MPDFSINTIKAFISPATRQADQDVADKISDQSEDISPKSMLDLDAATKKLGTLANLEATLLQQDYKLKSGILDKLV
jgi:hypothetical protein